MSKRSDKELERKNKLSALAEAIKKKDSELDAVNEELTEARRLGTQEEIDALEKRALKLFREYERLIGQQIQLLTKERTIQLLRSIHSLNKSNSLFITLKRSSKTTSIMDRFYYSQNQFLILKHFFILAPSYQYASLVIVRAPSGITSKGSNLTITDLKQVAGQTISSRTPLYTEKNHRLHPLFDELLAIAEKNISRGGCISFKTPCCLKAQTSEDQRGFGWVYHGRELISEGKPYGDASEFQIIGVLIGRLDQYS